MHKNPNFPDLAWLSVFLIFFIFFANAIANGILLLGGIFLFVVIAVYNFTVGTDHKILVIGSIVFLFLIWALATSLSFSHFG